VSGESNPSATPGAQAPEITGLDHVVLTVRDIATTVDFYERAIGMRSFTFAGGARTALAFGEQKINLHELGAEILPNARAAGPGAADFCLLTATPLDAVVAHLEQLGVPVEQGPSRADGARTPLRSIWLRDPDGNLVELANAAD
jgi:catechol 2,3-dioxygenase-like lactoylglutathione lyase family enzyme